MSNTVNLAIKKISAIKPASNLLKTALIPIVQDCDNYTTTPEQLSALLKELIGFNVQSDWEVSDDTDPAYIKHKPTILSQTDVDTSIKNSLKEFKVEVFNKNTSLKVEEFELDNFVNSSYDREVNQNITLVETNKSLSLNNIATVCTVGFTNTSSSDIQITIPNSGNNKCMLENVISLKAEDYVEIAMKGSGSKRVWTYLKQI